jgi:dolichol-phosphate mannosyltransferase
MRHDAEGEQLERLSALHVPPILTIVVPTLNERDNIKPLIALLDAALPKVNWELMFVDDDSADDTAKHIRALALVDPRVRCILRIGRRGLSTACIEGARGASK